MWKLKEQNGDGKKDQTTCISNQVEATTWKAAHWMAVETKQMVEMIFSIYIVYSLLKYQELLLIQPEHQMVMINW
jgi:hypothetical protein